jgi:hypothetical protein
MTMVRTSEKAITLQLPGSEIVDRGTVRLGSGCISATFPPLRLPSSEVDDRGTVLLGSGSIFASLPAMTS